MLVAHYLYIAVISGYYKRRDWQAWADRIILNNDNDDLETWIYDVSIAQNEEQLYEAICDKKRIEYFDEDSKYSQSDIVVGYYCLLFQEKRISIEELTSKLLDEDDNASDAEILKDKKVIRLIEKIFSKIYSLDNIKELGENVNSDLNLIRGEKTNYMITVKNTRFSNGEGKVKIEDTVRDKDIYIISDVGNYDITYNMRGLLHHMGPDEHFGDIKRTILALSGYQEKITLIMPLLYQARQHKRKGRESLDCALALQELERLGVNHIITFDAHDPNVSNAIPNLPFENFYPTNTILEDLLQTEDLEDILVISPDMGAMERARYYAELLDSDVGVFYKRRDLSRVINGKNPIIEHTYMGSDVKGKDILVVDDMIASGTSMLEVGKMLKEKKARKVYFIATFALFTEGIDAFDKAYLDNIFDKLYTTNLSYIPKEFKDKPWFHTVDCSMNIAEIINALHNKESLTPLLNGKEKILKLRGEKTL